MSMKHNRNFQDYLNTIKTLDQQEEEMMNKRQKALERLILEEGNSPETLFLIRLAHYEVYKDKMIRRMEELRKFDQGYEE